MTLLNAQGPTAPVDFDGYNTTGSTVPVFTAVRIDGAATHPDLGYPLPKIALALASSNSNMPCFGITTGDIDNGNFGTVRTFGLITDIDTSAFSEGDNLYVSGSVAGDLEMSNNPPDDIQQRAAVVVKSDATVGAVFVLVDAMLDGHVSYTNRDQFTVHSPTTASSVLSLSATGGNVDLFATPTGSRVITIPDATDTLVGRNTTDTLTNKSLTTPTIASFTNAAHNHSNAAGGGKLAVGTALTPGTIGYTLESGDTAPEWKAHGIRFNREMQYLSNPGLTTATAIGLVTAPAISGTVSNQDASSRPMIRCVTGAVSGNSAGVLSGFNITRIGWLAGANFFAVVGNAITSYRFWVGWTSATLVAVATPTTQHVAAFSYDTGRDGTVFFRTVTCDGTTATVTATSVAVTAGQAYDFRIVFNSTTSVSFYIDGVLKNTHTTNTPGTATLLGFQMSCTTLTGSTRRIDWNRVGIMSS